MRIDMGKDIILYITAAVTVICAICVIIPWINHGWYTRVRYAGAAFCAALSYWMLVIGTPYAIILRCQASPYEDLDGSVSSLLIGSEFPEIVAKCTANSRISFAIAILLLSAALTITVRTILQIRHHS
ncbi:hypothetical protein [Bifidobacterium samirii]|uniref:hypothetical protein n=1 Tax=Bifidobacterium samirii TaxID=2306974 RepID=UPI000F7DA9DE|nr:hypothetical protein [Bifidobacterium samirii]